MPFLEAYNPDIDWKSKIVKIPTKHGVTRVPTIFSEAALTLQQPVTKNSNISTNVYSDLTVEEPTSKDKD